MRTTDVSRLRQPEPRWQPHCLALLRAAPVGSRAPVTRASLSTSPSDADSQLTNFAKPLAGAVATAIVAAAVGIFINQFSDAPCALEPAGCEQIPYVMKVLLIATHLFAFALIPTSMYVFYQRAPVLERWGAKSPFTGILGLSFLMVSIASEIGWHVSQQWYYQEEYMILNFAFYFFLSAGTSLWAYGVQPEGKGASPRSLADKADVALLAAPVLMAVIYALGAAVTHTKVPMYIVLSLQYAILTWRMFELLDHNKRVFLFPFFSVGVNLFFISLLSKYESDKVLNPLFHILHDAAGTEMGIAIITALIWFTAAEQARIKQVPSGAVKDVRSN
ncbi:hypothetical protein WJX72_001717 [[Myrmecia] bisecta]|uniref:Uncharacterized protein n=1 Tax=[Myrmecia] bisecta TaxID=41462 RepID=A0AAW1PJN2_9CHLO